MAKTNEKAIDNPEAKESYKRFALEISNKTYALAYVAVRDCISQKEYCKRTGLDETKFSRVLAKLEEKYEPTAATT